MLPLPTSPVPVAVAAVLLGLVAARVRRRDPATPDGTLRAVAVHALPAIATAVVAVVIWTTPVAVWAWAAAGTLGLAAVAAPFANALRVRHRAPTPAEEAALSRVPDGEDVRVVDAEGRITGYAAGNPLTGTVAVSAGALAALPPRAIAALVAHERAHGERRHALRRAGASATVLTVGVGLVAVTLSGATAVGIGVLVVLAVERLAAAWVARRTEFTADAAAARRRTPGAVVALLSSLPAKPGPRPSLRRHLASHPSRERRLAAVRERFDADHSVSSTAPSRESSNRRTYPGVDPTGGMDREALAYALLFSVPPAIGMTGFSVMATSGGLINPAAALIGATTFGIIFSFVYVAATRGNVDESRSPGTM